MRREGIGVETFCTACLANSWRNSARLVRSNWRIKAACMPPSPQVWPRPKVLGERLARDVSQVGHRDGLHAARGRVADQRRLEDARDQRRGRLDQPELQEHLDHLAADHPDVRRRDLDAVDAGQLRDHLKLDGPVGHQLEGRERIGEDGAGGDPLKLLDHVFGPLVAFLGELILGLATEQMGAEQEVAGAERLALALEDLADPVAEGGRARAAVPRARVSVEPSAACTRTGNGRGAAAPATMSSAGTSPRRRSLSFARMAARVGVGEPVGLVEDDDRALPLADQGRQRLVLGADQVVVENEDQQVGARGQVAGFALARRAGLADLGQARRVGQEDGSPRPPRAE